MTRDLPRAHTVPLSHASETCAETDSYLSVPIHLSLTGSHQQAIMKLLMTDLLRSHTYCLMLPIPFVFFLSPIIRNTLLFCIVGIFLPMCHHWRSKCQALFKVLTCMTTKSTRLRFSTNFRLIRGNLEKQRNFQTMAMITCLEVSATRHFRFDCWLHVGRPSLWKGVIAILTYKCFDVIFEVAVIF